MAKSYRDEPDNSGQKKLLVIFIVLLILGLFLGFVYPGIWR